MEMDSDRGTPPPLKAAASTSTAPSTTGPSSNPCTSHPLLSSSLATNTTTAAAAAAAAVVAADDGAATQRLPAAMGVSSSPSSGNSGTDSRASSADPPAAAATKARAAATTTPSQPASKSHSPGLQPIPARVITAERGGRRKHKGSRHSHSASGDAGAAAAEAGESAWSPSPTVAAGGEGGGAAAARYPRTVFDRCKTARTIAAQWMSRLMRSPPEAHRIESYRVRLVNVATTTAADTTSTNTGITTSNRSSKPPTRSPTPNQKGGEGTSSFLAAVLKSKASGTNTATTTSTATTEVSAHAEVPAVDSSLSSPTCASSAAACHYEALELVPDDLESLPSLLHALREIALSCASLDTLARATSGGGGASANEEGATRGRGSKNAGSRHATANAVKSPSMSAVSAAAAAAAVAPGSPTLAPAADEAVLVTRSKELSGEYEAQWDAVRVHFRTVRRLVLNDQELVEALDAALGTDWRSTSHSNGTTTTTAAAAAATRATQPSSASFPSSGGPSSRKGSGESHTAATAATTATRAAGLSVQETAAASPLRRTAKEYIPREYHPSLPAARKQKAALIAATSTLNSNAEPFHTRYPTTPGGAASSSYTDPGLFSGTPVTVAAYSPSQAVASFLERVTPPPRGEGHCAIAAVFPATPPSMGFPGSAIHDDAYAKASASNASSSRTDSSASSPAFSPASAATTGEVGGTQHTRPHASPSKAGASTTSAPSVTFQLESREDMLRRRSAAPNTFYASTTHYYGGSSSANPTPSPITNGATSNNNNNSINSAATTPASFVATLSPGAFKHAAGSSLAGGGGAYVPHRGPCSLPVSPIMTYGSPVTAPQCPYDYILVIDFEATCEEHPPANYLYEIIEFPVVLVDVHLQRAVAEFHRFVRPRFKHQLSEFCRSLTGIEQADVDEAAPLEDVIVQFERWCHQTVPPASRVVFATDGPMDFREFMHNHSVLRQNIRFPTLFYQWIDVKQAFSSFFQCQQGKIKAMLEVLHCPFEGRLHSGIDDARNIARIVIGLLQWGCTLCDVPLSRISVPSTTTTATTTVALLGASSTSSLMSASMLSLPFGSPLYLPPSTATTSSPLGGGAGGGHGGR